MNLSSRLVLAPCVCLIALAAAQPRAGAAEAKKEIVFRVRPLRVSPDQPVRVQWRWGGEGLGGDPVTGEVTADRPRPPGTPAAEAGEGDALAEFDLGEKPADRIVVEGSTYNYTYLRTNAWSDYRPVSTFGRSRGRLSVTFMAEGHQTGRAITNTQLEFEFAYGGTALRRFTVDGPDGPTFGVMIPFHQVDEQGAPKPDFAKEVCGLREYVESKAAALRAMPWAGRPTPKLYGMLTDCFGYGTGAGYGVRTTDRQTLLAEYEVLRLMGLNGTRGAPPFILDMIRDRSGVMAGFTRVREGGAGGYPIPMVKVADGAMPIRSPGDGCPFHPDNVKGVPVRSEASADAFLASMRAVGVDAGWALTVDEIGTVFGGAPEGKAHQGCCPYCREAFREMIRADGHTLADFGAPSWDDIRSTYGYWASNYWDSLRILTDVRQKAKDAMDAALKASGDRADIGAKGGGDAAVDQLLAEAAGGAKGGDPAKEFLAADERLKALEWNGELIYAPEGERKHRLSPEGWSLLEYYSARFNCEAAARLFEPLQKAYAARNQAKVQALARGETDSAEARQPWIYSFALRGNTFLMGPHSLDFFDFYRHADNGFVYETSNRDRRVWHWDSYLCDVGRSNCRFLGKTLGIYIKPHRGAPVQRALTAVARGTRMIFWYTYGPEWAKGDTFGGDAEDRNSIGWVSRMIAGAEDVTYDSDWAVPAEVAIVRPRTAEFFSGPASWENGKWVYSALTQAHVPVDPLDESLLLSENLSRYKVIVVSGSHIRRAVAEKLRTWVEAGGTLYTCGWGMAQDEACRPLDTLWPVFGVASRGKVATWSRVPTYGATSLGAIQAEGERPAGIDVAGRGPLKGTFTPMVGREVLAPVEGAEVMATYADGSAAAIRHRYGKGTAWLVGVYAGLEYAWETMNNKPFSDEKRTFVAGPVLEAGVRPVVDADVPLVEGVLLRNRASGKRAAILINWEFHTDREVKVVLRGAGPVAAARSLALAQAVPVTGGGGDTVEVRLPRLDEGDILLLE